MQIIRDEISSSERRKALNFCIFLIDLIKDAKDSQSFILRIIIVIFVIGVFLAPLFNISIDEKDNILTIMKIYNLIFYIISLMGLFGRFQCCCLYRPCNWLFLMLLSDLIVSITGFTIGYIEIETDPSLYFHPTCMFLNAFIYVYIAVYNHCKTFNILKDIYKSVRNYEINIIKNCVIKFIKNDDFD